MFRIPYSQIVEKIKEEAKLSDAEIEIRVKQKLDQLSGLISKEGAATIIANELGIKLYEKFSGKLQIRNIVSGMRSVEVVGKVIQAYEQREFQTKTGTSKVASVIIGDETGTIRVVCWGAQADNVLNISPGMTLKVKDGYTRDNSGRLEIHTNDRSLLEINPPGEVVEVKPQQALRKKIEALTENDSSVEVLGAIVQVFDPRFYEVCPECNKRIRQRGDVFVCEAHGERKPSYGYVLNLFLDDGSQNIRTIFFTNQAEQLLNMKRDDIMQYRTSPQNFEQVKKDLLGTLIKVSGRVAKNQMFDRLELVSQSVVPNPNPEEELQRLQK
ncbi:MAG TPA: OB-fold nucleic acid binding domain-containing protein [Candidatus Nanoarchaeia archaeon]|nr:OB-fold nucleic acid binding domain-containing protein [Candidatus Nanoarchaeia archaeon]